jgi:hypothetical protein
MFALSLETILGLFWLLFYRGEGERGRRMAEREKEQESQIMKEQSNINRQEFADRSKGRKGKCS